MCNGIRIGSFTKTIPYLKIEAYVVNARVGMHTFSMHSPIQNAAEPVSGAGILFCRKLQQTTQFR